MVMRILDPGPQASLQGAPRGGFRQFGMPAAGAADPLSMSLANRLVGNRPDGTCIEVTYGPFAAVFERNASIAITGAVAPVSVNGSLRRFHTTLPINAGDVVEIGRPSAGLRFYVAVAGEFRAEEFLGSTSTYMPAKLGGLSGRALQKGDVLEATFDVPAPPIFETPTNLILTLGNSYALRSTEGPDYSEDLNSLWTTQYTVTRRASRIGIELGGHFPKPDTQENLPSAAIFPGALQLPPKGRGFLLLPDCQTTGGYPHVLQVNKSDRHLLGQVRPDDSIIFLRRSAEQARADLAHKDALFKDWVGDVNW